MSHHQDHEAEHTPAAIRRRLEARPSQDYLKDSIYGAIDGAVTTFAVVSSVAGAGLSSGIVIILGLANLLADGFSMASGNFLGTRAENQAALRTAVIQVDDQTYRRWAKDPRPPAGRFAR